MLLSFLLSILMSSPLPSTFDREKSPYTGYTRETWVAASETIISGVMNYVDPETGIFSFPEPEFSHVPPANAIPSTSREYLPNKHPTA